MVGESAPAGRRFTQSRETPSFLHARRSDETSGDLAVLAIFPSPGVYAWERGASKYFVFPQAPSGAWVGQNSSTTPAKTKEINVSPGFEFKPNTSRSKSHCQAGIHRRRYLRSKATRWWIALGRSSVWGLYELLRNGCAYLRKQWEHIPQEPQRLYYRVRLENENSRAAVDIYQPHLLNDGEIGKSEDHILTSASLRR